MLNNLFTNSNNQYLLSIKIMLDLYQRVRNSSNYVILYSYLSIFMIRIDTAIPLGLIINELITNIIKYAFPQNEGTITIQLKSIPEKMELTIADDGIRPPKDIDLENPETLGLQLVQSLLNQLDGDLKVNTDKGTEFKIIFKELKYKKRL